MAAPVPPKQIPDPSDRRIRPLPVWPWALAPLLGLMCLIMLALGPFAFGEVERVTATSARRALLGIGADWAELRVSGQWVTLMGAPPSRRAAEQAVMAVRQSRALTLFGEAQPVTRVDELFTWAKDPAPGIQGQQSARPANRETAVSVQAEKAVGPAAAPAPTQAQLAKCDRIMSRLLNSATIGFSSASNAVSASSDDLLDAIADAAGVCPGLLRIEGHTDSIGRAGDNLLLSRRRAEAVRVALVRRGVPAARLVVEGFGALRPIADNREESGRARNRRIEIHAIPEPN